MPHVRTELELLPTEPESALETHFEQEDGEGLYFYFPFFVAGE